MAKLKELTHFENWVTSLSEDIKVDEDMLLPPEEQLNKLNRTRRGSKQSECYNCGKHIPAGVKLCSVCRREMESAEQDVYPTVGDLDESDSEPSKCNGCGKIVPPGVKFCRICKRSADWTADFIVPNYEDEDEDQLKEGGKYARRMMAGALGKKYGKEITPDQSSGFKSAINNLTSGLVGGEAGLAAGAMDGGGKVSVVNSPIVKTLVAIFGIEAIEATKIGQELEQAVKNGIISLTPIPVQKFLRDKLKKIETNKYGKDIHMQSETTKDKLQKAATTTINALVSKFTKESKNEQATILESIFKINKILDGK